MGMSQLDLSYTLFVSNGDSFDFDGGLPGVKNLVNYTSNADMEKAPRNTVLEVTSREERDVQTLARLGKKAVLKACLSIFNALHW